MFSRWSTTTSLPSVRLIWLIRQHERSFVIRTQTVRIQRTIIANCELLILSPSLPHSPCRTSLSVSPLCLSACLFVCVFDRSTYVFFSLYFSVSLSLRWFFFLSPSQSLFLPLSHPILFYYFASPLTSSSIFYLYLLILLLCSHPFFLTPLPS